MTSARYIDGKSLVVWLLVMAAMALAPHYASRYAIILLSTILMYVVLSVSWAMFSGPTKYISLAPAAFFGAGIYSAAVLGSSLPLLVVILIGGAVSFCLAVLVGALTLRLRGIYFVMFTFGLVELLMHFLLWFELNINDTTGRVVPSIDNSTVYYLMLAVFSLLMVTVYALQGSKFGMALKGVGENEEAAAHIGVNVTVLKITVFGLSAFFMGLAGAIMATKWTYIDPKIAFNPVVSFMPVLMAIFGGLGRPYGPIIGAAIFSYLGEFLITKFPYYYMLIFGVILVVAILYMPGGLVGMAQDIRKYFLRRQHADS
ncbi:MAG: branched-chain amino acid ABC transporter permease [Desulfarculaceae bacterium]|nr:branched-chain amino acid ABC transporter permease [Desulfarculaceae bacterium]